LMRCDATRAWVMRCSRAGVRCSLASVRCVMEQLCSFLLPTAASPVASAWSESSLSTYALRHLAAFGTARKHTFCRPCCLLASCSCGG
jgi:hypothetical protein